MGQEPDLAVTLKAELRRHPEVDLALLFGSRARGGGNGASDVDVAVEGEGVDRLALARDLSAVAGLEVDVVDLRRAGYPLLQALLRDGVVLHEGRPHAEARFRTRAILLTETARPWYKLMRDLIADREWPPARDLAGSFRRLQEHGVIDAGTATALGRAVGLRNVVAHVYAQTDPDLLFAAATGGLEDLERSAGQAAASLETG